MGAQKGLIFGSMPCASWDFLQKYQDWADVVIAADGGITCAEQAGIPVNVYVGDNDSGGQAQEGMFAVQLNPVKDFTDLQAAYSYAVEQGMTELIFTGCTGGRQDHHLAALQLLETARRAGISAKILDDRNEIEFLFPGTYQFTKTRFKYFSLVPVDAVLGGVSIQGAKYSIEPTDVFRGNSLTISNEWSSDTVTISFNMGCCFFIRSN